MVSLEWCTNSALRTSHIDDADCSKGREAAYFWIICPSVHRFAVIKRHRGVGLTPLEII